jgi:predicted transcriptional regulator
MEDSMKKDVSSLVQARKRDGAWLKESRQALGLSQNDLASRLRLSGGSRSIRKYELGERPVSGPVTVAVEAMLTGFQPSEVAAHG